MKNILTQEELENIKKLCIKYNIKDYRINNDGSIDVNGGVLEMISIGITKLPLKFNIVSGDFWIQNNNLTTLEGCPVEVGGDFFCNNNNLSTLEGSPRIVRGAFYASSASLESLDGAPEIIGGLFHIYSNQLTSLKGAPEKVIGMACYENKLSTLQGCPIITTDKKCYFSENEFPNPVIMKLFKLNDNEKLNIFVKYQDHFDVWENGFNEDNFNDLMAEINDGLR